MDQKDVRGKLMPLPDDIALEVLNGRVIKNCASAHGISVERVIRTVNHYCRRTNPAAFRDLQTGKCTTDLAITVLRDYRHRFLIKGLPTNPITQSSSIWCLLDVPTVTLEGLCESGINTIEDVIVTPMPKLKKLNKVGPQGLSKVCAALRLLGFDAPGAPKRTRG